MPACKPANMHARTHAHTQARTFLPRQSPCATHASAGVLASAGEATGNRAFRLNPIAVCPYCRKRRPESPFDVPGPEPAPEPAEFEPESPPESEFEPESPPESPAESTVAYGYEPESPVAAEESQQRSLSMGFLCRGVSAGQGLQSCAGSVATVAFHGFSPERTDCNGGEGRISLRRRGCERADGQPPHRPNAGLICKIACAHVEHLGRTCA